MRKILSLSVCMLAVLATGCGKARRQVDAGVDPSSDPCLLDGAVCSGAIAVELNTCPKVSITATPLHVALGDRVLLVATVFDAESDAVAQSWFADPDGKVDATDASEVYFDCESIGRKTINLVATDEHDCTTMDSVEVVCIDPPTL